MHFMKVNTTVYLNIFMCLNIRELCFHYVPFISNYLCFQVWLKYNKNNNIFKENSNYLLVSLFESTVKIVLLSSTLSNKRTENVKIVRCKRSVLAGGIDKLPFI